HRPSFEVSHNLPNSRHGLPRIHYTDSPSGSKFYRYSCGRRQSSPFGQFVAWLHPSVCHSCIGNISSQGPLVQELKRLVRVDQFVVSSSTSPTAVALGQKAKVIQAVQPALQEPSSKLPYIGIDYPAKADDPVVWRKALIRPVVVAGPPNLLQLWVPAYFCYVHRAF